MTPFIDVERRANELVPGDMVVTTFDLSRVEKVTTGAFAATVRLGGIEYVLRVTDLVTVRVSGEWPSG